jgi:uncharacterized repeat protein (TIGR01451 family)
VTISYTPGADLSVTKAGSGSARAGDTTTYTLTVANNGPVDATGVTVTDTLPAGLTFVSSTPGTVPATPGAPTCTHTTTPNAVTCALGTMVTGTAIPVYITVAISDHASGILINTATVSDAATNAPDPNPADNTATIATSVNPAIHDGHDGHDGRDGHDGHDGAPGGHDGRDGHDGPPGHDGRDGRDGHEGHDGRPGQDGHEGRPGHDGRDRLENHDNCTFDNPHFPFC